MQDRAVRDSDSRAERTESPSTPGANAPAAPPPVSAQSSRWKPGQSGNPRGRVKSSITSALKRAVDPRDVALFLIGVMDNPKVAMRERLQAAGIIYDRLEGKPVARNLNLNATASAVLPVGFAQMERDQQLEVLAEIRARALAGNLQLDEGVDNADED